MKNFAIPVFYRSSFISRIKEIRKQADAKKKDFTPTSLSFGEVEIILPRHFGFCYGVENAIEIAYKAIEENPGKKIYLLSQMIHNPHVNADLQRKGIRFIADTEGNQFIPWSEIGKEDIVIIPAFGTSLEVMEILKETGAEIMRYNTTCPFVERVWKKSEKIARDNFTIIIHGKYRHEETRATFSHAKANAPALVILNMGEAQLLGNIILENTPAEKFYSLFAGRYSEGFDVKKDLKRIGIVNQTTMLASETKQIAEYLREVMIQKYGKEFLDQHFADTRDTLCYATNDNQDATLSVLSYDADLAIVVGGYNSSNTSHLVELLEQKFPVYFIAHAGEIDDSTIHHFDIHTKTIKTTDNFLPSKTPLKIIITSGASCPDSIVEEVMRKILALRHIYTLNEEALLTSLRSQFL